MKRSPAAAFWLSLVPGAGHVYLGLPSKGLVLILAVTSSIFLAAEVAPTFFGPMIGFLWVFTMVDAHRTALEINHLIDTGQPLPERSDIGFAFGKWWGWGLILAGVVLTVDNYDWFDIDWVYKLWPVALIAIGAWLLKRPAATRATPVTPSGDATAGAGDDA